jgi:hypothetical protein
MACVASVGAIMGINGTARRGHRISLEAVTSLVIGVLVLAGIGLMLGSNILPHV